MKTEDVVIWASNVAVCVLIVFANKYLMGAHGFQFATTLSALHFLSCSVTMWARRAPSRPADGKQRAVITTRDLIIFTIVADLSILCLNLSLLLNDVTFYQIAKLLVIPFICGIEAIFFGRKFTLQLVVAILVVLCGVATVTVAGFHAQSSMTLLGFNIAAASVVFCGLQQILCRSLQQKHGCTADELLSAVAPAQGITLLLVGPFVDKLVTDHWVLDYRFTTAGALMLVLSCALAVGVNISQFKCLGRFTAGSFQVLGHTKTVLVLLGGWLFLGDVMTSRRVFGMGLAVAGMIWYGKASYSQGQQEKAEAQKATDPEEVQVLVEAAAGEKGALPSRRDANMVVSGSPKASH